MNDHAQHPMNIIQENRRQHRRSLSTELVKTYGPDAAGIEYWYPIGTRAVRIQRCHRYIDQRDCTECANKQQPQQNQGHVWNVETATGARHRNEGPGTFTDLTAHQDFECAARHLIRIHTN